ncbi:MAG TPA: dienelactone hydrolase family protein [bacterium]
MTARAAVIEGREVQYASGTTTLRGYFAYDSALEGKRPGVLVVHEWWGLNDYTRRRARMLAELGYAALAVDMFGDGKTAAHPDDAGKFAGELTKDPETTKARFLAGLEFLKAQPQTDAGRIAAIGYCMGGGVVLNMARAGLDLKGVASFHGSLAPVYKAAPGGIKARLLVMHGADDTFVPPEAVAAFKQEMADAKADMTFIAYPGAKHSFTNPDADEYGKKFNLPLAYNAEADRASWEELRMFLGQVLK